MFRREPKSKLKNEEAQYVDSAVSVAGTLQREKKSAGYSFCVIILRTGCNLKPNAEPKTIPKRQSQPTANRVLYGSLYHGSWITGTQTALIGFETTELGINLKAMILINLVS
jgi:hypothetical protein